MKILVYIFCLISMSVATETLSAPKSYMLHGEIKNHEQGKNKWTRRIRSKITSGVPLIIELNEQIISLEIVVEPPPSVQYTLAVSLLKNPKSDKGISTILLANTFQSKLVGREQGPFEFKMEKEGIEMSGVVGLSAVH